MHGCGGPARRSPCVTLQGGEGHAPPKSRWPDRPHQKFVHLVFLSARPESFKGLTVRPATRPCCCNSLCQSARGVTVQASYPGSAGPDWGSLCRKPCP